MLVTYQDIQTASTPGKEVAHHLHSRCLCRLGGQRCRVLETLFRLPVWLQHVPTLQRRHAGLCWEEPDQALLKCQGGLDTRDNSVHSRERAGACFWCRGARVPLYVLLKAGKTQCKGQRLQGSCICHTQCEDCPCLTCSRRLNSHYTRPSLLL